MLGTDGQPITFADGQAPLATTDNPRTTSALHAYGTLVQDEVDRPDDDDRGNDAAGPDVNALAKAKGATPFKRPENGVFQPGSKFKSSTSRRRATRTA